MTRIVGYILLGLLFAVLIVGCQSYPYYGHYTYPYAEPQPSYLECSHYLPYSSERASCNRGVRQRLIEEQRRRDNDAYHRGLGR